MKNKKLFASFLLTFVASLCFAKTKVADLKDVRIYSLGGGCFEVESNRVQQCFPLTFNKKAGWIEVACSSTVKNVTADGVGSGVKYVVKTYLTSLSKGTTKFAGEKYIDEISAVAGVVAKWAINKGVEYLCN